MAQHIMIKDQFPENIRITYRSYEKNKERKRNPSSPIKKVNRAQRGTSSKKKLE